MWKTLLMLGTKGTPRNVFWRKCGVTPRIVDRQPNVIRNGMPSTSGNSKRRCSTHAIDELLNCPKRRVVLFAPLLLQCERCAKFRMEPLGAIAHYRQSAAFLRAILSESCDDHMTTRFDRVKNSSNVCLAVFVRG